MFRAHKMALVPHKRGNLRKNQQPKNFTLQISLDKAVQRVMTATKGLNYLMSHISWQGVVPGGIWRQRTFVLENN